MYNLPFVIWMLGWPLLTLLEDFFWLFLMEKSYSIYVTGMSIILSTLIWIIVGKILYITNKNIKE